MIRFICFIQSSVKSHDRLCLSGGVCLQQGPRAPSAADAHWTAHGMAPPDQAPLPAHCHQQQIQNAPQHFEPCCLPRVLVESGSCRQ